MLAEADILYKYRKGFIFFHNELRLFGGLFSTVLNIVFTTTNVLAGSGRIVIHTYFVTCFSNFIGGRDFINKNMRISNE